MNIALLEPFFSGSHSKWAEDYKLWSKHRVKIYSLKGKYWKWRMYGGAVSLAEQFLSDDFDADLLLATDMLDLGTFLGLSRKKTSNIPSAIYFHENQITYPWSPEDEDVKLKRDNQYGFINYTSALAADAVLYNSNYHQQSFLGALASFLKQFPDRRETHLIEKITSKSSTLHLGMDLKPILDIEQLDKNKSPVILWNHRWEYDKNPEVFFKALFNLKSEGIEFKLIVTGASFARIPEIFEKAKKVLKDEILHFGYAETKAAYHNLLIQSDILLVTSNQDFFGGSVVEGIAANCYPILPNRLAYPEHIPNEMHTKHFYQDQTEMYDMLKSAIQDINIIRQAKYSHFVSRYDWSILANEYDQFFEQLTP